MTAVATSPSTSRVPSALQPLLDEADIVIGGRRPHDVRVHDERVYDRILGNGTLAAGESYMDGMWDCDAIDALAERVLRVGTRFEREPLSAVPVLLQYVGARIRNLQGRSRAWQVAEGHYDLGNDLFEAMLGSSMAYTCGYWNGARSLEEAQASKLELICQKLDLRPGMRVLDIGCGFGAFMKHAAERHGVECVGYSVSREQTRYAKAFCAGLPVEIVLDDYRDIRGTYDRVVSIGMFEAVGVRNYRRFMETVSRALAPGGSSLLHTVGTNQSTHTGDPWLTKYIFPNGMLPSIAQIGTSIEGLFVMEDWHTFEGHHYADTLAAWRTNFRASWSDLSSRYDERFRRMFEFYLGIMMGGFRARSWHLWQIVLTPVGGARPTSRVA